MQRHEADRTQAEWEDQFRRWGNEYEAYHANGQEWGQAYMAGLQDGLWHLVSLPRVLTEKFHWMRIKERREPV